MTPTDHLQYLCTACYSKNTPEYDLYCTPCKNVTDNIVEVLRSRIVTLDAVSIKLETSEPDLKKIIDLRKEQFIYHLDTVTGKKQRK
jgi:hypothetical protein